MTRPCIVFLDPQFSIDLQLIGGVLILQTLPAVALARIGELQQGFAGEAR